jgi:hypothetical protein
MCSYIEQQETKVLEEGPEMGTLKNLSIRAKSRGVKAIDLEGLPRTLKLPTSMALQLRLNGVLAIKTRNAHDQCVWSAGCNYGAFMGYMMDNEAKA